jgi:hypothetical protein
MNQAPDRLQILWRVRGTIFIVVGVLALVAVFTSTNWQFYLIGALSGLGFGAWDIRMAVASMSEERARGLSSPDRVANAEEGLQRSGWINPPQIRRGDNGRNRP